MLNRVKIAFISLLLLLALMPILTGCGSSKKNVTIGFTKSEGNWAWKPDVYHRFESNLSLPLGQRFVSMPEEMLFMLKLLDSHRGILGTEKYKCRKVANHEVTQFLKYFTKLSSKVRGILGSKVLFMSIVDDFRGAAYTGYVLPGSGDAYYFIVFNSRVFLETLDSWLSSKENSTFVNDQETNIAITTGLNESALLYALLHETAHIVDSEIAITPYVYVEQKRQLNKKGELTDFVERIWIDFSTPIPEYDIPHRHEINTYGLDSRKGLISASEKLSMFQALRRTPFVSFYSTKNWSEHFAEFFTYHQIRYLFNGNVIASLKRGDSDLESFSPMRQIDGMQLEEALLSLMD